MVRFFHDLIFARYIHRRAKLRTVDLCQRKSDGTLWAAGSPQVLGYALAGLFSRAPVWHFQKVREWRGLYIVAPRIFWTFSQYGKFEILAKDMKAFKLPAWDCETECRKLDARTPTTTNKE